MDHGFPTNCSTPNHPSEWVKRRARATEATSKLLAELAFDSRLRRLGDQGTTLANDTAPADIGRGAA